MKSSQQRLPLTALRSFEAAARLLSFKAAAEELRVTPTSVSNQIRQLELDWGCLLFVRKTRKVFLTDAGRSLARVMSRAFDDIRAEVETHISSNRKTVTLAVGPIFGARWLIPRLSKFYRLNPNIELVLHHSPRITDVEQLVATIAVDWGIGDWQGLNAHRLLDVIYRPVLSPSLLAECGGLAAIPSFTSGTARSGTPGSNWWASPICALRVKPSPVIRTWPCRPLWKGRVW